MTDQEKLLQVATEYVRNKAELDALKKRVEGANTSIKQLMELLDVDEVKLEDGSRVVCGITKRESLDEEKAIKQLKKFAPDTGCIKTKEYIDMDILEGEIYRGNLSDEAMQALDTCRKIKEIPTLTIKKPKKGT